MRSADRMRALIKYRSSSEHGLGGTDRGLHARRRDVVRLVRFSGSRERSVEKRSSEYNFLNKIVILFNRQGRPLQISYYTLAGIIYLLYMRKLDDFFFPTLRRCCRFALIILYFTSIGNNDNYFDTILIL